MKIIEAMKKIKMNDEKVADLYKKIQAHSAHLSHETPMYPNPAEQVRGWVQSCIDTSQESVRLLTAIQRTNISTHVTIDLSGDGNNVTKTIAEWVWRRRKYATFDLTAWSQIGDRGLREGLMNSSIPGQPPSEVKIVRNYDPKEKDHWMGVYREEPHRIDSALEIVNATTDLME